MMVDHNRDVSQRMAWFDRQFLRARDFIDDQDYALDRRHRHNQLLHTSGVADGLVITGEPQDTEVTVSAGTALDDAGREIILLQPITESFPASLGEAVTAEVYLAYEEQNVEPSVDPGVTGQPTRVREAARVVFRQTAPNADTPPTSPTPAASGPVAAVLLAELTLKSGKLQAAPVNSVRRRAGAQLSEAALPELLFKVDGKPQSDWPRLSGKAASSIGVTGDLALGSSSVLWGPDAGPARATYDSSAKRLSLTGPSGVVAHTSDTGSDALQVDGSLMTGSNTKLRFTSGWSGFPDDKTNGAEISNDIGVFKTLMIVGNKSGGAGRRVGIWDHLAINGTATVLGDLTMSHGAMTHVGTTDGSTASANEVVGAVGFWGNGVQHCQLSFRAGRGFELCEFSKDGPRLSYPVDSRPYADLHARQVVLHADTVNNVNAVLNSPDRLHISGGEILYLLNKNGVIVGKEWGGNGNLSVQGDASVGGNHQVTGNASVGGIHQVTANAGTAGKHPVNGLPTGWGGGLHTWDVFAEGSVGAGPPGVQGNSVPAGFDAHGTMWAVKKPFVISHPLHPEKASLVHGAVEGPEYAVFYRGEGQLADGAAIIELPSYFEALTRSEGRTIQLTPVLEGKGTVSPLAATRVKDGSFEVRTADGSAASHAFFWEVKAVRADVEPLQVEVSKDSEDRHPATV